MATRKEKEAARKGSDKTADDAAREEGAEASLAVRESSDLDTAADETEEANDESQEQGDEQSDELAEGDSEEAIARQLGADRYVMAGFFALAILAGYVLGRTIQTIWANLAGRDWFNQALPLRKAARRCRWCLVGLFRWSWCFGPIDVLMYERGRMKWLRSS
jgi:preprotein translocase subunit SecE